MGVLADRARERSGATEAGLHFGVRMQWRQLVRHG
jgi:hypothetical protein